MISTLLNYELIIWLVASVTLVIAGLIDFKYQQISNFVPLILMICGGLALALNFKLFMVASIFQRILGFCLPLIIGLIFLHKKAALGGGDVKLMAASGFVFGLSSLLGLLMLTVVLLIASKMTIHSKAKNFPLATYLAIGYGVYSLLGICQIIVS